MQNECTIFAARNKKLAASSFFIIILKRNTVMKLSKIEAGVAWMQIAFGVGLVVLAFTLPFRPWTMLLLTAALGIMLAMLGVHILYLDSKHH